MNHFPTGAPVSISFFWPTNNLNMGSLIRECALYLPKNTTDVVCLCIIIKLIMTWLICSCTLRVVIFRGVFLWRNFVSALWTQTVTRTEAARTLQQSGNQQLRTESA